MSFAGRPLVATLAFLWAVGACSSLGCVTANPATHPTSLTKAALRIETDPVKVAKIDEAERAAMPEVSQFSVAGDVGRDDKLPRTFALLRGSQPIDEQDFYEVAGDTAAAAEVKAYRDRQILLQYLGYWAVQPFVALGTTVAAFSVLHMAVSLFVFPPFALFGCALCGLSSTLTVGSELAGLSVGNVAAANVLRRNYVLPLERARAALGQAATPATASAAANVAAGPIGVGMGVDVRDPTGCVDADALRRDIEALVATGKGEPRTRVRLVVTALPANTRRLELAVASGTGSAPVMQRTLEITAAECGEAPRMVTRIVRQHVQAQPQAH